MVKTFGLTHINLAVRNAQAAFNFYHQVFGLEQYVNRNGVIHASTRGAHDVVTFDETVPAKVGQAGGIVHFGFRLTSADDIDSAVEEALKAGGVLLRRGHFAPGVPYAYIQDLDGYEVEIWFE